MCVFGERGLGEWGVRREGVEVKYKRITYGIVRDSQGRIRKPRFLDTLKINHEKICFVSSADCF